MAGGCDDEGGGPEGPEPPPSGLGTLTIDSLGLPSICSSSLLPRMSLFMEKEGLPFSSDEGFPGLAGRFTSSFLAELLGCLVSLPLGSLGAGALLGIPAPALLGTALTFLNWLGVSVFVLVFGLGLLPLLPDEFTRILLRSLEGTFRELPVDNLVMVTEPMPPPPEDEEDEPEEGPPDVDDDPEEVWLGAGVTGSLLLTGEIVTPSVLRALNRKSSLDEGLGGKATAGSDTLAFLTWSEEEPEVLPPPSAVAKSRFLPLFKDSDSLVGGGFLGAALLVAGVATVTSLGFIALSSGTENLARVKNLPFKS